MTPDKVTKDVVVSLQYKLRLDDGTLAEESEPDDPLMYLHGYDNIIPGLERALEGMRVGESRTVIVEPLDGYGEYDPDDVGRLSRSDLPPGFVAEVGMILPVVDEMGHEGEVEVVEIEDDSIVVDFNHPMAGERLEFEVEITELREASAEELDHGHVHDHGHQH
jgi:FKBP-type peptidyl-prolyl cis-trans isomerase SlyD